MTSEAPTPGRPRRPYRAKALLATLMLAGAGLGLTLSTQPAGATAGGGCASTSIVAPVIGSWYAQVFFPSLPFPGRAEATMITFTPGGGIVEANAINTSPAANSGFWKWNADCSYSLRLLNFTYDPVTTGVQQILDVQLRFVLTDLTHWHSTSADAKVYFFNPKTGARLGDPIAIPTVSVTTAERFNTWPVPTQFPPEP
jgi:hypothetical protein